MLLLLLTIALHLFVRAPIPIAIMHEKHFSLGYMAGRNDFPSQRPPHAMLRIDPRYILDITEAGHILLGTGAGIVDLGRHERRLWAKVMFGLDRVYFKIITPKLRRPQVDQIPHKGPHKRTFLQL